MKKNLLFSAFFIMVVCGVIAQPNFNKLAQITGSARINSTKVDNKGNIYYTGFYNYSSDFNVGTGTYTITAKGATDPFIAKYDSNYNLIWVKSIGGTSGYDYGYHIAVDDSGYVYGIGAIAEGACDLDPGAAVLSHTVTSVTGGRGMDIYIIKLDSVGNMKWVETFPSYNFDMDPEWYIDIDNAGNIVTSLYVRAGTTIDLNFGIGSAQPHTFSTNTFALLKQSKYQQSVWLQSGVYATHFDFDENNNIYAVGDKMNIFKLNSAGTYVWGYILGTATSFNVINTTGDYASAICYDKKGHIYITGSTYNNAIDYNPGSGVQTLSHNNNSREIYVLKWDTSANFKWVKKFDAISSCGTEYYNYSEDIKTDNRGNVYTCGGITSCDFDPSPTNTNYLGLSCSGSDLFVSKLDSLGNYVWAKSIGSVNGTDYLKTMAITPAENVFFGGFFSYQFDIDPGPGVTYIGTTTSVQNALVGGIGCNKFSEKKDSTCVMPYVLNGYNYTQGGHYIQSIAASGASCDSLIYLDLKATNPDISVSSNTAICIGNAASLTVNSTSSDVTYEWSTGDNITNIVVSPTVTTMYTATVTSITDSNCKSTKTISVTVNNLPIVTLGALSGPICVNTNTVTLNGTPSGGTYAGTGVSGNSFIPNAAGVGTHTLMYVYTDGNGCSNNDTTTVQVNNIPIVTLDALSSPMCVNANSVTLNGLPNGGTYTGAGVSGNVFNPFTAGAGTHTLMYVYTDGNGCSNNNTTTVQVNNLPIVTLAALSSPMCVNVNSVTLNGSPVGGTYSGTSVSGNSFSPNTAGIGTYTLMYAYTDGNGCSNNDSAIVQVVNLPIVTLGALTSPICVNTNTVTLNGSPSGGSYTGVGVSGNVFNPTTAGAGTHTLVYVYTDGNGCSNNDTTTVQVDLCTGIMDYTNEGSELSIYPNPTTGFISIALNIVSPVKIEILNVVGESVYETTAKQYTTIDLSSKSKGVYFVKITDEKNFITNKRIVIQ